MTDPRTTQLAQNLIRHSCRVQSGEHVLLEIIDAPDEIAIELIRAVRDAGAHPHINLRHSRVTREMFAGATDELMKIGIISSEVERNTAISVPAVITPPEYRLAAPAENPHCGMSPMPAPST